MFRNKKVVLGITGGISAYKCADIASWLRKNGAEVHCVMTKNATEFISPLVFQTLTGRPVVVDEFATGHGWQVVHISLVENADLFAIVPATANVIAKIAHGIADDAFTSSVLAATCPKIIAPAMNCDMYNNVATQSNIATLADRGWNIINPAKGMLACGVEGVGKLPPVEEIEARITEMLLPKNDFAGKKVVVTAGPTSEPIDPVRYITNRSSGKMGYAIAEAAAARGAEVVLVSGKTKLLEPVGVKTVQVESAVEMREAVLAEFETADVVLKAAAVADYRVAAPSDRKIKKTGDNDNMILELVKNPDILAELGSKKTHQFLVGFAAETHDVEAYAKDKLVRKNADLLVANDVSQANAGFDVDTNIITIFSKSGEKTAYPMSSKVVAANNILDKVLAEI